jgi:hypothetical protein
MGLRRSYTKLAKARAHEVRRQSAAAEDEANQNMPWYMQRNLRAVLRQALRRQAA